MYYLMGTKPENWDHRDKSQARWLHGSLIGRVMRARFAGDAVSDSPTTTQHQKELAKQICKLSEELEHSLRNERVNC